MFRFRPANEKLTNERLNSRFNSLLENKIGLKDIFRYLKREEAGWPLLF
jgi:hypothetical protein